MCFVDNLGDSGFLVGARCNRMVHDRSPFILPPVKAYMSSVEKRLWSAKYRPDDLSDVIGQEKVTNRMEKWTSDSTVPHLILNGPPGVGKTASAVAFAKMKYGDQWQSNLVEFNSSDDRGINVVRERIHRLAKESPSGDYDYKIILLDEFDHATKDAQAALRRIMEKYSDQTRFFLSLNYLNKVIDPIQSRCTVLPFNRLEDEQVETLLTNILNEESVEYEEDAVNRIIDYVDGDARRAVQTLQTSVEDGELTSELLEVVGGQVDRETIENLLSDALRGNMEDVHSSLVYDVLPNTIDYSSLLHETMKAIRDSDEVHDDIRWHLISRLGEVEQAVNDGNSPQIQLMSFFAEVPVVQNSSMPNYSE